VIATTTVRVARSYRAPAARVFDAWLDPVVAGRFLFATAAQPMTEVEIDAQVGGRFRFVGYRGGTRAEHAGRYIALARPRLLAFALAPLDDIGSTRVTVELAPRRTGCRLTLAHEDVPAERVRYLEGRWAGILFGLGETLAQVFAISGSTPARESRARDYQEVSCTTC
jgi:uncharacterized protein YndB with AHSA1/START domain